MADMQIESNGRRLLAWDAAGEEPAGPVPQARAIGPVAAARVRLGGTAPAPPRTAEKPPLEDGIPTGTVDRYAANLEVKPIANSRLIQVRATARDPDLAQAIANAHANEYIRRTLQAKFELTGE